MRTRTFKSSKYNFRPIVTAINLKNSNEINREIKKILIVNRGEIALKIIKIARSLGIATVAFYSESDRAMPFVAAADEKFALDGNSSAETYLNMNAILNAIKVTGADAVHPGYGFLAENAVFADLMEKNNVIFIGPSVQSILAMGNKVNAKNLAIKTGVKTVPGSVAAIENIEQLFQIAKTIGYPVMLKAANGGGGRGIRIVHDENDLEKTFVLVKNEAKQSFNDETILIEKYIENPRHIEIQIIGDKYGNLVSLGERDCSIQRFNQKIIEEAPSSFLTNETRKKMEESAILLAKNCNYYSVGTVEYVVDKDQNFYFLEMNTRLQVEYGVTEYVTGINLITEMIRIAQGNRLRFKQEDININGSAIEVRICAEDPSFNFLPSTGRITQYHEPKQKIDIRIDSGFKNIKYDN